MHGAARHGAACSSSREQEAEERKKQKKVIRALPRHGAACSTSRGQSTCSTLKTDVKESPRLAEINYQLEQSSKLLKEKALKGKLVSPSVTGGVLRKRIEKIGTFCKKARRHVSWADDKGDSLTSLCPAEGNNNLSNYGHLTCPPLLKAHEKGRPRFHSSTPWRKKATSVEPKIPPRPFYKEALLCNPPPPRRSTPYSVEKRPKPPSRPSPSPHSVIGRCYKCVARDHRIRDCREPWRCFSCLKLGHSARYCQLHQALSEKRMHRALGFHPPSMKFFVPVNEGFLSCQ